MKEMTSTINDINNNNNFRNKEKSLTLNESDIFLSNNINNKDNHLRKYSYDSNISQNKKIKYNNSLTNFNNNKNENKKTNTLSFSQLKDIHNDIYLVHMNKQNKARINTSNSKNKSKKKTFNKSNINFINKYEIYNKDKLAYNIYHDYKKLNFNDDHLDFLERMDLYNIKRNERDKNIQKYINILSPKMPEKERERIFYNLFKDFDIQKIKKKELKEKFSKEENCIQEEKIIQNGKKYSQENIDEIVHRLYSPRKKKCIKLKKESSKNLEAINNNIKSHNNFKIIKGLNERLYYGELNKKDIPYKLFLQKVKEFRENNGRYNSIEINNNFNIYNIEYNFDEDY